jgi:hypothetical protein
MRSRFLPMYLLSCAPAVLLAVSLWTLACCYPKHWDLTADKQFSLPGPTVALLRKLPHRIKVLAFVKDSQAAAQLRSTLARFSKIRPDAFELSFHDSLDEPALARELRVGTEQVAVLQWDEESIGAPISGILTDFSEAGVCAGIRRLLQGPNNDLWSVTGGGEHSIADNGPGGLSLWKLSAGREGFNVRELDWKSIGQGRIPAGLLVLAGTRRELAPVELRGLARFLAAGGRALVLLDPSPPESLVALLKSLGLEVGSGAVVDNSASGAPVSVVGVQENANNPVTCGIELPAVFKDCAPLNFPRLFDARAWFRVAQSRPSAQVIAGNPTPSANHSGYVLLAGSEGLGAGAAGKLLVSGTATLVDNRTLQEFPSNLPLGMKLLDYLAAPNDRVVDSSVPIDVPFSIPGLQRIALMFFHVVVLPSVLILLGAILREKRRGQ